VVSRCSLILAIYGRPHSSECGVSEHRALAAALAAGDVAEACALMATHLEAITDRALISREEPDLPTMSLDDWQRRAALVE
jgi:DNA-binding GntR family transcriptional regulator